jgi:hypothetical protein
MGDLFKIFDAYSLRARLFPAIIGGAPALAALALLISWSTFSLSTTIATLGLLVIVFAMADLARRRGTKVQPRIFAMHGGTAAPLRRNDDTFSEERKAAYRAFLARKLGRAAPTAAEEAADPAKADAFYEAGRAWLRESTRDTKKFAVLFNENVTYGFRRNLLGVKWPGVGLNVAVVVICAGLLAGRWPISIADDFSIRVLIVLAVAVIHAAYMLFGVTWVAAVAASKAYGRQLILSIETFLSAGGPTPRKKNPA